MRGSTSEDTVAVVVGGSIAGTLSAGVLAKYFDRVLIVEKDQPTEVLGPRRGVPHAQHFHVLLERGRRTFESIFPGFTESTVQHGATLACNTRVAQVVRRFGRAPRFDSTLDSLYASRELIERTLREKANALRNVSYLGGHQMVGLCTRDGVVRGVRVSTSSGTSELEAAFVVDARGRQSSVDELVEAGYEAPEEIEVNAHWGYTTTFVKVPDDFDPGFLAFSALPLGKAREGHVTATRGSSLWVQDGDRWILTAMGSAGDHPPGSEEGLREWIAGLGYEDLQRAVEQVTFLSRPRVWRNTVNRLRRYDQVETPRGFLVVGDAMAAFNPVYGQGMTVASLQAAELDRTLADAGVAGRQIPALAPTIQRNLAEAVLPSWRMATFADYRVDGVDAPPPPPEAREMGAYMDRVEGLASEDREVYMGLLETTQLLRSSDWMRAPEVEQRIRSEWGRLGALVGASE